MSSWSSFEKDKVYTDQWRSFLIEQEDAKATGTLLQQFMQQTQKLLQEAEEQLATLVRDNGSAGSKEQAELISNKVNILKFIKDICLRLKTQLELDIQDMSNLNEQAADYVSDKDIEYYKQVLEALTKAMTTSFQGNPMEAKKILEPIAQMVQNKESAEQKEPDQKDQQVPKEQAKQRADKLKNAFKSDNSVESAFISVDKEFQTILDKKYQDGAISGLLYSLLNGFGMLNLVNLYMYHRHTAGTTTQAANQIQIEKTNLAKLIKQGEGPNTINQLIGFLNRFYQGDAPGRGTGTGTGTGPGTEPGEPEQKPQIQFDKAQGSAGRQFRTALEGAVPEDVLAAFLAALEKDFTAAGYEVILEQRKNVELPNTMKYLTTVTQTDSFPLLLKAMFQVFRQKSHNVGDKAFDIVGKLTSQLNDKQKQAYQAFDIFKQKGVDPDTFEKTDPAVKKYFNLLLGDRTDTYEKFLNRYGAIMARINKGAQGKEFKLGVSGIKGLKEEEQFGPKVARNTGDAAELSQTIRDAVEGLKGKAPDIEQFKDLLKDKDSRNPITLLDGLGQGPEVLKQLKQKLAELLVKAATEEPEVWLRQSSKEEEGPSQFLWSEKGFTVNAQNELFKSFKSQIRRSSFIKDKESFKKYLDKFANFLGKFMGDNFVGPNGSQTSKYAIKSESSVNKPGKLIYGKKKTSFVNKNLVIKKGDVRSVFDKLPLKDKKLFYYMYHALQKSKQFEAFARSIYTNPEYKEEEPQPEIQKESVIYDRMKLLAGIK